MRLIDDPVWVRDRYVEARELLADIRDNLRVTDAEIDTDIADRLVEFWETTYLDGCTTFGPDCACNELPA